MGSAIYINISDKDQTVKVSNQILQDHQSMQICDPVNLGLSLEDTLFKDMGCFNDMFARAVLSKMSPEKDVAEMLKWMKGAVPYFGRQYTHFHTNDKTYLLIVKGVNSALYECLRFFYLGDELMVSVDKSAVDIATCLAWLADESVNAMV